MFMTFSGGGGHTTLLRCPVHRHLNHQRDFAWKLVVMTFVMRGAQVAASCAVQTVVEPPE